MSDAVLAEELEREEKEERSLTASTDRRLLARLLRHLRPYRGRVAATILLMIVVAALGISGPYLVKLAIDRALDSSEPAPQRSELLWQIASLYLALLVANAAFHYVQIMLLQSTGQRVMLDLRRQLFRHLLRQDLTLFDRQPVGRLMTRLTSDIEALNELFTSGLVTVAMDLFTLGAIMTIMIWMDWRLALLSFLVIPALFALALIFRSRVRRAFRRIRIRLARINSFLQEHIAGIAVVQGFDQVDRRMQRFDDLNLSHTRAHLQTVNAFAVFFPAVELLSMAAVVLLIWQGGAWVGAGTVSLGTLVAFIQYAQRFYRPISDLSEKFNILQGAMAASERIFELLDTEPRIAAPAQSRLPDEHRGEIRFEKVAFGYDARAGAVLRGISFHVRPGERIALVGSTGAGKTTIISLLNRFYDLSEGQILVDGIEVRDWDPQTLRRQIAIVLQDPRLFSGTLRENLTLWDESFDVNRLREALDRVGLDRVIERLPRGLDEDLREGGTRLSTGERQLVAFARALAHDPPILVLDEATASIDPETEARIQRATEELLRGRTSLIIAHRLTTVRDADRILVLHHGKLVEQGTHEQLMREGRLYRRLVELQLGAARAPA